MNSYLIIQVVFCIKAQIGHFAGSQRTSSSVFCVTGHLYIFSEEISPKTCLTTDSLPPNMLELQSRLLKIID